MKSFTKYLIVWISQNLAIPFWMVGHVHLSLNAYKDIYEIIASFGMNILVATGFIIDYLEQKNNIMPKAGKNAEILFEHYKENVYPIEEAAEFLGISKRTVATYIKKGKLKGFLFRNVRFFKESELRRCLAQEFFEIK